MEGKNYNNQNDMSGQCLAEEEMSKVDKNRICYLYISLPSNDGLQFITLLQSRQEEAQVRRRYLHHIIHLALISRIKKIL